jgi:hypothetical protein
VTDLVILPGCRTPPGEATTRLWTEIKSTCTIIAVATTLVSGFSRAAVAQQPDLDPRIAALVGSVSEARLAAILKKLEGFGTRNTLSSTDSPINGIGAARQWILDEMKGYSPKLQVSFDTYTIAKQGRITRDVEVRNVMAVLPGRSARRVYVSGHYDTVAVEGGQSTNNAGGPGRDPVRIVQPLDPEAPNDSPAPGVNDDGSGTALTELARISPGGSISTPLMCLFVSRRRGAGLFGAYLHAQRPPSASVSTRSSPVYRRQRSGGNGVVDGATIPYSEGPRISVAELARFVQRWGARYVPSHRVWLMARPDRFNRGGDHTVQPASDFQPSDLESCENRAAARSARQFHALSPLPGAIPEPMWRAATIARASTARRDDKGRAPIVERRPLRCESEMDAVSWRFTAYGLLAGGVIDFQHDLLVGDSRRCAARSAIDDYVFGVAAVDAAGHESVVACQPAGAGDGSRPPGRARRSVVCPDGADNSAITPTPARHRDELDARAIDTSPDPRR